MKAYILILSLAALTACNSKVEPLVSNTDSGSISSIINSATAEKILPDKYIDEVTGKEVYSVVEEQPSFGAKPTDFISYLYSNLKMPSDFSPQVFTFKPQFVIDVDGSVIGIRLDRPYFGLLPEEKALVDLFRQMPKWNPGRHKGKAVAVIMTLPISISFNS